MNDARLKLTCWLASAVVTTAVLGCSDSVDKGPDTNSPGDTLFDFGDAPQPDQSQDPDLASDAADLVEDADAVEDPAPDLVADADAPIDDATDTVDAVDFGDEADPCGNGSPDDGEECDDGGGNTDTACVPAPNLEACTYCTTACESVTVRRTLAGQVLNLTRFDRTLVNTAQVRVNGVNVPVVGGRFQVFDQTPGPVVVEASAPPAADRTAYSSTWREVDVNDSFTTQVFPQLLEGCSVEFDYPFVGRALDVKLREACPGFPHHMSLDLPETGGLVDGAGDPFTGRVRVVLVPVPPGVAPGQVDALWTAALPGDGLDCEGNTVSFWSAGEVRVTNAATGASLLPAPDTTSTLYMEPLDLPLIELGTQTRGYRFDRTNGCWEPVETANWSCCASRSDIVFSSSEPSTVNSLDLDAFGWWAAGRDNFGLGCVTGRVIEGDTPVAGADVRLVAFDQSLQRAHWTVATSGADGSFCGELSGDANNGPIQAVAHSTLFGRSSGLTSDVFGVTEGSCAEGGCYNVGDISIVADPGLACADIALDWDCSGSSDGPYPVTVSLGLLEVPPIGPVAFRGRTSFSAEGGGCIPLPGDRNAEYRYEAAGRPRWGITEEEISTRCPAGIFSCQFNSSNGGDSLAFGDSTPAACGSADCRDFGTVDFFCNS